jgi:hypothetical protein
MFVFPPALASSDDMIARIELNASGMAPCGESEQDDTEATMGEEQTGRLLGYAACFTGFLMYSSYVVTLVAVTTEVIQRPGIANMFTNSQPPV